MILEKCLRPTDLLHTAKILLDTRAGQSAPVCYRRAVSSAYYALFHCLARDCADLLIGANAASRSQDAWKQVYRSLEHTTCKERCKKNEAMKNFPPSIGHFGNAFVAMQDKRHRADYDPFAVFTKNSVEIDIDIVERAIVDFKKIGARDRRAFCAYVLFKSRT
jgi:hypothetical protein